MDFRGHEAQQAANQAQNNYQQGPAPRGRFDQFRGNGGSPVRKIVGVLVLLAVIAAVYFGISKILGGNGASGAVQKDHYQAVFLNNGQVYFGHIKGVNKSTLDLRNIYYLQTNNGGNTQDSNADNNVSLVKLGCELHAPYDQMIINRDQVIFWENIQDSSQVVKAIDQYSKSNSKQNCSQQSQNSTQQAPATGSPETTNPTTNPSAKP